MTCQLRAGVAAALIAAVALANDCVAHTYLNDAFGISVEIPERLRTCTSLPPTPDRGFVVLPGHGTCEDGDAQRIAFSLSYNASLEHRTTGEVARDWCGAAQTTWAPVAAGGVRMMECARPSRDGMEKRLYIGLRSEPRVWFGQWTVVAIFVQCRPDAMHDCVRVVGELAHGVRWRR